MTADPSAARPRQLLAATALRCQARHTRWTTLRCVEHAAGKSVTLAEYWDGLSADGQAGFVNLVQRMERADK